MANTIELAKKFVPVIDEIYKAQSVTDGLDSQVKVDFAGTNEVKVLKVSTTGLGNYSRAAGYPKGDVTAAWETMKLAEERGKEISIDRMDDEETLGLTFGTVVGNFMQHRVTPEVDAFRFARYASTTGIGKAEGALTADSIIAAIDNAGKELDGNEAPSESRVLFVSSDLKPVLNQALKRQWGSDNQVNTVLNGYNGMPIIYVPKTRFYTALDMKSGEKEWGFAKADAGKDINFMVIEKSAIVQATKFALPKIFDPDTNQDKDAWKFQFRLYHDAFVYENKKGGIYLHVGA